MQLIHSIDPKCPSASKSPRIGKQIRNLIADHQQLGNHSFSELLW
jgi:hypothetical protein